MKIQKRDGNLEQLSFDKIIYRLKKLCNDRTLGVLTSIDPDVIAQRVVSSIYDGVTSCELDEEAARIAIAMTENPEYQKLASRIVISNTHKSTIECFSEVMERLYNNTDSLNKHAPILADDIIEIVRKHKNTINFAIDYNRDYLFDYFGYKTLEKSYLQKIKDKKTGKMQVIERPQHLYMRVAIGIHKDDIESAIKTYNLISQHYYTHASPTMFNGGTVLNQYSSCFLLGTEDSLEGIFKTITDCAKISKLAGGIGLHVSNIRAKGSLIRGTNGPSDGLIPMVKVYNEVAKYINQGGKRKGSFAIYLEPHHSDILEFLDLKKNQGHEDVRARDLFYAMWISDLFMKQVEKDGDWYLMCPDECPGLSDIYGDDFEKLYWSYVEQKRYKRVVKAQEVWTRILDSQIETGTPYIGYKDAVNKKCNQKNLGTIKSSNLCIEISLYSDNKEYAVCNLCSIALPKFVKYDEAGKPYFDFEYLKQVSEYIIQPMNKVIDNNYYPVTETKTSNMNHRPIGVGVQGLVDVYVKMRLPFESEEAKKLNKEIFETIYYGCLKGSIELAKKDGAYSSFKGSPFSEGKLQFDLAAEFDGIDLDNYLSGRWDWKSLKEELVQHGTRNSMLLALMPTASTAQIMGNSECFEPVDSCIFKRRVLSGEYIVVNKYLVEDLVKLGLWNKNLKDTIIANNGSIQNIDEIPDDLKALYKTVWEISMKSVIEQCSDRGVFVDQMQSMNLFMANPNYKRLTSMHFYAWKSNLKSGMYYLRSKSSASAGKFSIDPELEKRIKEKQKKGEALKKEEEELVLACSRENPEACMMCSS
jgi:ribonucleoside-diphosphate reductase alpha chain